MKSLLRSFAGGEITPEMFGRLDLTKFQTGVKLARNMRVRPHGPLVRRSGTRYINWCKTHSQVRLLPFVYNATDAVVIEFGNLYVRFHNSGGAVLEPFVGITNVLISGSAEFTTGTPHGYSVGQRVFIENITGAGFNALNRQYFDIGTVPNSTSFTLTWPDGNGVSSLGMTFVSGGAVYRVYELASQYTTADLPNLHFAQDADNLTITLPGKPAVDLQRLGPSLWSFFNVDFTPTLAVPGSVTCVATKPTPTNVTVQRYVVTAVGADLVTESTASISAQDTNTLSIAGNYNTISWAASAGAARYNVYKQRGGSYGFIGTTAATSLVDDNILPDQTISPPSNDITLNDSAGNYPAAVTYFEQRRVFGGTTNRPQNVWMTRNGTRSNLTTSLPTRDDDALSFRTASQQQNAIRHIMPLSDLIALTVGGEFRIFSDGQPSITPTSLSVKPQSYGGASNAQPVLTTSSVLYVQAQGASVREIAYDPAGTGVYRSVDITLFAPHLFEGFTITELAFVRAPEPTLWAVRSDGALLAMTYVPEQQVFAWHQHTLGGSGAVESIAVIPEGNEDVLFMVVRRTINSTTRRHIERLTPQYTATQADKFFVDSGLTYNGAPATVLTGLRHLDTATVQILADGAVVPPQVVVNGSVTLPVAASKVSVGLGYVSDVETLPAAFVNLQAAGQGTNKNVSEVYLRVRDTSVLKAGPSFDKLTNSVPRPVETPYGSAPALRTGEVGFPIGPSWNSDGTVCVRQDQPLPLTLVSMATDTVTGG